MGVVRMDAGKLLQTAASSMYFLSIKVETNEEINLRSEQRALRPLFFKASKTRHWKEGK